ncbi:hypothetical protein [Dermacoccus nishinomiyaensis]|uniref:hypothetical protein n=1 Tax=Dermacoccus nishinomiyaensis TaxID=1274 RepID=UPI00248E9B1E|nr:hypothetical protein [Dermacoccus nishinomiyaensis]
MAKQTMIVVLKNQSGVERETLLKFQSDYFESKLTEEKFLLQTMEDDDEDGAMNTVLIAKRETFLYAYTTQ